MVSIAALAPPLKSHHLLDDGLTLLSHVRLFARPIGAVLAKLQRLLSGLDRHEFVNFITTRFTRCHRDILIHRFVGIDVLIACSIAFGRRKVPHMRNLLVVASGVLALVAAYACSSDPEGGDVEEQTGGANAQGGNNASGSTSRGGGLSTAVGGTKAVGGSKNTGGTKAVGGTSTLGAAGNSSGSVGGNVSAAGRSVAAQGGGNAGRLGGAGTSTKGGSAGAGGRSNVAGASGRGNAGGRGGLGTAGISGQVAAGASSAGATSAGATSFAGNGSCDALCGGSACATQPKCLGEAFGIALDSTLDICVKPTSVFNGALALCEKTLCDGVAGCALTVTFGSTTWTLNATSVPRTTDVQLDTSIANLVGPIGITGLLTCSLTAVLPSSGLPMTAHGSVSAPTQALNFDSIEAPLTDLTVASTNQTCQTLANSNLATALPSLQTALLEAIQTRAQQLACLDCRGDCPQALACVAR